MMAIEQVHTVVLGAGPAGLAAGYTLAKAGCRPVVVEKGKVVGGLMRSIKRGEFIVDVGRKELYNRLAKVDAFWGELLGDEYRAYPHRGGILFDGHIMEISPKFRGFRRGMPWGMFAGCAWDLMTARVRSNGAPRNLEEYFYQRRGRRLTQVISQGFQEKLTGVRWADVPLEEHSSTTADANFLSTLKGLLARTFSRKESNTFEGVWKHPARGTGQICETLERGIREKGGRFIFAADVLDVATDGTRVTALTVQANGETVVYQPQHVVSSIPAHFLLKLLLKERFDALDDSMKAPPSSTKTIVLVYLFFNESPRFPHAWLNVTCSKTRMGRITNYSGVSGDMVPEGKACLCCEFYCGENDPLLRNDDSGFVQLALQELSMNHLADPAALFDSLVLRLPGADASQNRHNWMTNLRHGLLEQLRHYSNVYYVARTDLDIATLAGIESAEAIISGNRSTFDHHVDPANLDIRSAKKAFEFRNPAERVS